MWFKLYSLIKGYWAPWGSLQAEARNLKAVEQHLGKSDPYCQVEVEGPGQSPGRGLGIKGRVWVLPPLISSWTVFIVY